MAAQISQSPAPRFIRRTSLAPHEYRKNFHQIDADIIAAITSPEADQVTPLMSKIYLCLATAPAEFHESTGVLYFAAKIIDGKQTKASKVLHELLGVASATAHKALMWMHEQGIIGYYAGKNGVGIRIFLNRAASSIGVRDSQPSTKILPFARGSNGERHGSTDEPAFKDSFAVKREVLDPGTNPHAPKCGADKTNVSKASPEQRSTPASDSAEITEKKGKEIASVKLHPSHIIAVDEIIKRLKCELEPSLQTVARQAATLEHERTREWLERRGLPKAARVAQREAYNVLRQYGLINDSARASHSGAEVGRTTCAPPVTHPLSEEEIMELAEGCVALLEAKGQAIAHTLSPMSQAAGGFLLPEDVLKVRACAESLIPISESSAHVPSSS